MSNELSLRISYRETPSLTIHSREIDLSTPLDFDRATVSTVIGLPFDLNDLNSTRDFLARVVNLELELTGLRFCLEETGTIAESGRLGDAVEMTTDSFRAVPPTDCKANESRTKSSLSNPNINFDTGQMTENFRFIKTTHKIGLRTATQCQDMISAENIKESGLISESELKSGRDGMACYESWLSVKYQNDYHRVMSSFRSRVRRERPSASKMKNQIHQDSQISENEKSEKLDPSEKTTQTQNHSKKIILNDKKNLSHEIQNSFHDFNAESIFSMILFLISLFFLCLDLLYYYYAMQRRQLEKHFKLARMVYIENYKIDFTKLEEADGGFAVDLWFVISFLSSLCLFLFFVTLYVFPEMILEVENIL